MRRNALRVYAPFLAVLLGQAAFVVVAPSQGEEPSNQFGQVVAGPGSGQGVVDPETGAVIDPVTGEVIEAGSGGTGGGAASGGSAGGGGATGGGGGGQAAARDTSHCKGERQHDVIYNAPLCVPKWPEGADNGGATYPGVTKDEIKFILFQCQSNPQVDALLHSQGLAATDEETDAMLDAWAKVINKYYETYGRTF